MTKRQRVMAALRGQAVDRVPLAFWLHNFATENSAKGLADETQRLHRAFDWDFLKPQSRAQCFAEMWGLGYAPSGEKARPYTVTRAPIADADDLAQFLQKLDAEVPVTARPDCSDGASPMRVPDAARGALYPASKVRFDRGRDRCLQPLVPPK